MEFYFQRSSRGPLKAVLLDWAGTTMDYGCYAPAVVFVQVYERKGVPISVEEARVPMGAHKKVHIRKISEIEPVRERWQGTHGRPPNEDDVEAMFQDFIPLQMNVLADYADLIPGTLDAVKDFRARGLKVGSTTGYHARDDGTFAERSDETRLYAGFDSVRGGCARGASRTVYVSAKHDQSSGVSARSGGQS